MNSQQLDLDENGRPQFDINSNTVILDIDGSRIDFKTFIKLSPGKDYTDLHPNFNSEGSLENITINLVKPTPPPKRVIITQSSPSTESYPNRSANIPTVRKTYPSSPKVERTTNTGTNKKFRFTTAKELEDLEAPFFSEKDINGKTYSSSNLLGNVIVLKFWFTKCGPCLEEIPELNKLVAKYKHEPNVKFLAAATDDYEAVKKFLTKKNFKYKMLYDTYDIHGDFKVAGYPTHMIIHKSGIVAKVFTGKNSSLVSTISEVIDQALALGSDDRSMKEVSQPLYTPDKVFKAEENYPLTKDEYLKKLSSGQYKIFEKMKMDGRKEYFLMRK